MERKVCYVINFYFGDRRCQIERFKFDKLCYLKSQIETLQKYRHSLSKIIFSFNVDIEHYKILSDAINIIPKRIQNTDVEINVRENYGMSYAAFSEIFVKYTNEYDYYIFNEDDYVIVQDDFDNYLIKKYESLPNCGYLCGLVRETAHFGVNRHAGMSSGICGYKVLKEIFDKYGELPHSKNNDYIDNEKNGQTNQTAAIKKLGYEIYDIREEYRMCFWTARDSVTDPIDFPQIIHIYFMWHDKDFFLPAKIYFNETYRWVHKINKEFLRMECDYNSEKYYLYEK